MINEEILTQQADEEMPQPDLSFETKLILDALQDISSQIYSLRVDLNAMATYYQQVVQAAEVEQKGGLPLDFPGREQLETAGITAVAQIPRTIRGIEELVGDSDLAMAIAREMGNRRKP